MTVVKGGGRAERGQLGAGEVGGGQAHGVDQHKKEKDSTLRPD